MCSELVFLLSEQNYIIFKNSINKVKYIGIRYLLDIIRRGLKKKQLILILGSGLKIEGRTSSWDKEDKRSKRKHSIF